MADLISRQAALEVINGIDSYFSKYIEAIPAADVVERKTGKWIRGKCDQCGAHAPFWPMASTYYESDFCPNCGSEMRGDDHETD